MFGDFLALLATVPAVLLAITFHEAAHGYVARMFGDPTATKAGRVSFNPFRHMDWFGTILLPGILIATGAPFLFGYAKPVPVNSRYLRNPKRDMIWVALAGPMMNFVLAFLSLLAVYGVPFFPESIQQGMVLFLYISVLINLTLGVFNLWPLPPLDGGRVVSALLPCPYDRKYDQIEPFGMWIVIGLFLLSSTFKLGIVEILLIEPRAWLLHLLEFLSGVTL